MFTITEAVVGRKGLVSRFLHRLETEDVASALIDRLVRSSADQGGSFSRRLPQDGWRDV